MTSFSAARFALGLPLTALMVLALLLAVFGLAVARGMHRSVDVAWGLGFGVVAAVSYAVSAGHGSGTTRGLLLVLTAVWRLRLAGHIAWRRHGQPEDRRYADLVARAPGNPHTYALRKVYLTQPVVPWFVSLPIQAGMYARGAVLDTGLWHYTPHPTPATSATPAPGGACLPSRPRTGLAC
jgi:steroid 5-alpha reductase family enzyme